MMTAKISVPVQSTRLKPANTEPSTAACVRGVPAAGSSAAQIFKAFFCMKKDSPLGFAVSWHAADEKKPLAGGKRLVGTVAASESSPLAGWSVSDHADVLVPQARIAGDEAAHQLDAHRLLQDLDLHPVRPQQGFFAGEGAVLADDHLGNAVQQDGAAAHRARRQGGVEHRLAVHAGGLAAGVLQRVHLGVQDRAAALHAAVVPAADDTPLVHDDRSDRDAALGLADACLFERGLEERVHQLSALPTSKAGVPNLRQVAIAISPYPAGRR